jgi:hypothetical protein
VSIHYIVKVDLIAELAALTSAFDEAKVEYALCGAVALAIHGVPRATQDIDILAREATLDSVRAAAKSCGFTFEALPMTFSSSGITMIRFTKLVEQRPLMLDVLLVEHGLEKVWEGRLNVEWNQGAVTVVSRDGLITLKLMAARPQDLVDIQKLKERDGG